jgi:hypothetical protein
MQVSHTPETNRSTDAKNTPKSPAGRNLFTNVPSGHPDDVNKTTINGERKHHSMSGITASSKRVALANTEAEVTEGVAEEYEMLQGFETVSPVPRMGLGCGAGDSSTAATAPFTGVVYKQWHPAVSVLFAVRADI